MQTQQATLQFFVPIALAYGAICGGWILIRRRFPDAWPAEDVPRTSRPWLDLALALLASVAVLAVGQLWWRGWLLPERGALRPLIAVANHLLVYSPIAVLLALRHQGPRTVFLPPGAMVVRLVAGLILGLLGTLVFLGLRSDLDRLPAALAAMVRPVNLGRFVPVFLEGIGLAFLFVRLRWALGRTAALLVPCLLFAVAHVPRQVRSGAPMSEIALFFAFNTALPMLILATVARSRDVVWIGVAHYVMDVPSGAFE